MVACWYYLWYTCFFRNNSRKAVDVGLRVEEKKNNSKKAVGVRSRVEEKKTDGKKAVGVGVRVEEKKMAVWCGKYAI